MACFIIVLVASLVLWWYRGGVARDHLATIGRAGDIEVVEANFNRATVKHDKDPVHHVTLWLGRGLGWHRILCYPPQ